MTPQASASKCATQTAFTYAGTLSAAAPGTVRYQWVYSSGKPGPVRTVTFTSAGHKAVTGKTVKSEAAGSGWGEIKMISPAAQRPTANQTAPPATYPTAPPTSSRTSPPTTYPPVPHMSITINAPTTATVSQPYSGTLTAAGGDGNYTWGAASRLPPGLTATANGATLTISGTPTTLGQWTPSGYANDGEYPAAVAAWSLAITVSETPVTIGGNLPPFATVGQPYSGTLTAMGGEGSYTWSTSSRLLPPGLTATANGATLTISGTPAAGGTFADTADVSDSYGATNATTFDIIVSPASQGHANAALVDLVPRRAQSLVSEALEDTRVVLINGA